MNLMYSGPIPKVRRWSHPIEVAQREERQCDAVQSILCALAGQNQVLCAIKAELDEIYDLLQIEGGDYQCDCAGDGEECK